MKFSLRGQGTGNIMPYIEPTAHLAVRGFFRKIYLNNRDGVPSDKPVLLAANHPTAFIDPYLLCMYLNPPIYNMTRGDVFRKNFYRKLMEGMNMFPVFRVRDGYASRDRNDEVFQFCIDKLAQRRVVTIYVEGEHHLEKHVRPVQKGIARIAFAAYEQGRSEDLRIIPAGSNYKYGDRTRDEVMINIGQPLYVRDYWTEYQSNPQQATARLCADVERALQTVCLHVEQEADYKLAEQLLTLYRSEHPASILPLVLYDHPRFTGEKSVCDRVNALEDAEKENLREHSSRYFHALQRAEIKDEALVNPQQGHWAWFLFFIFGFLPFLTGFITAWPVRAAAYWVADKKVKKKEFYSSVILGVGHLTGLIYYLLLLLVSLISLKPVVIGIAFLLPLLGWFSVLYQEMWSRWQAAVKAARHPERGGLLVLRQALRQNKFHD